MAACRPRAKLRGGALGHRTVAIHANELVLGRGDVFAGDGPHRNRGPYLVPLAESRGRVVEELVNEAASDGATAEIGREEHLRTITQTRVRKGIRLKG